MIRILLADDQAVVRKTLQFQLEPEPDVEIVGEAKDGQEAIELVTELQPDVVLMDLDMPIIDGLSATEVIRQQHPNTKVLVLTSQEGEEYLRRAMTVGIQGYLLKTTAATELAHAIRAVHQGYFHLGPGLFEKYAALASLSTPQSQSQDSAPQTPESEPRTTGAPQTPAPGTMVAVDPRTQTLTTTATVESSSHALVKTDTSIVKSDTDSSIVTTETTLPAFDRPVVLQQSPMWSRVIIWGIVGVTTLAVAWACVFKIEEAVPATGQLKPQGDVKDVQVPVSGVVREIFVEDGQQVKKGELLLRLNPKATKSELDYLVKTRKALQQENAFYRSQMQGGTLQQQPTSIPPDMLSLAESRRALGAENRLFRSLLTGTSGANLTSEEQLRLRSSQQDVAARTAAANLRVGQLRQQLQETKIQLASGKRTLEVNQGILDDITPLAESGALAKVQYLRQLQEVETGQADVDRLQEQIIRLELAIDEGQEEVVTTVAGARNELLQDIATNGKQIADIDSRFTKQIVDNNKQLADIKNQLTQARLTLQYQELKSPVDGKVFDLKAHTPGFVANASEPILKIVPSEFLLAEVYITNKDIGFVKEGLPVDVRIDSFPFSEFGDIQGTLESIGSDALEPTEERPFFHFPAQVKMDAQTLQYQDRLLPLQSGMSISVNIKLRKRTIMSIFTSRFTQQVDRFKGLR